MFLYGLPKKYGRKSRLKIGSKPMRVLMKSISMKIITHCKNLKSNVVGEYRFFLNDISDYILYFGSLKDILYTPYFHFAVIVSVFVSILSPCNNEWSNIALGVLPSILGFSVGGYAIIITFGDDEFRRFLANTKTQDGKSILLVINGAFIHFIASQTLAIFLAYIVKSTNIKNIYLNFLLSIPFAYSLFFCVAIAFEIKTISKWYKKFLDERKKQACPRLWSRARKNSIKPM